MLQMLKRLFSKADPQQVEKVKRSIKRRSHKKAKPVQNSRRQAIIKAMRERKNNVPPRHLTKAWRSEAMLMRQEGVTIEKIAETFNVDPSAVTFAFSLAKKQAAA